MKQFVFGDADNGQSVVTITHEGETHDPDEGFARPRYRYVITTEHWAYSKADILGEQEETPDLDKAAQSVFFFLWQCVTQENDDFPINVRCWAGRYIDEIADLATPSEDDNSTMVLHNGSLVESDEKGVAF